MSISAVSAGASASPALAEGERTVLVLKKQQDVAKQAAQSLIALVRQAAPEDGKGGHIDLYA